MKRYLSPLYALPALAGLLASLLMFMVIGHMNALSSGRELLVPARGYDPRDLLLGHYVLILPDLTLDLEKDQETQMRNAFGYEPDDPLYTLREGWLALEQVDNTLKLISVTPDRPHNTPEDAILVHTGFGIDTIHGGTSDIIRLRPGFDINRYYANQKEALRIEEAIRDDQDVTLILSIGRDGQTRLKGVAINDERIVASWW